MANKITICMGSSCYARGNKKNLATIENFLKDNNLESEVELVGCCCKANCSMGPNLEINGKAFSAVNPETLLDVLEDEFKKKK